jgi:hypothetical protein
MLKWYFLYFFSFISILLLVIRTSSIKPYYSRLHQPTGPSQNDIRGLPSSTCGKNPPCLRGGCNGCEVRGVTVKGCKSTLMPGACMFLGREEKDMALRYDNTVVTKNVPS